MPCFCCRAKLLKSSPRTNNIDAKADKERAIDSQIQVYEHAVTVLDKMGKITICQTPVRTYKTLLEKVICKRKFISVLSICWNHSHVCDYLVQLRQNLSDENVDMLEQLFKQEGLIFVPQTVEELEAAIQHVREKTISSLKQKIEKFRDVNIEVMLA